MRSEQESKDCSKPGTIVDVTDDEGGKTQVRIPDAAARFVERLKREGITARIRRNYIVRGFVSVKNFIQRNPWRSAFIAFFLFVFVFGWREARRPIVQEDRDGFAIYYEYHYQCLGWDLPPHRLENQLGQTVTTVQGTEVVPEVFVPYKDGNLVLPRATPSDPHVLKSE